MSASPVLIALRGMASYLAEAGSWTITRPEFSLMALSPKAPSEPIPEKTTQTAFCRWSTANCRKKKSMGIRNPRGAEGASKWSFPCRIARSALGGITYAAFGWTRTPSSISVISIWEVRCNSSASSVLWVGVEVRHEHKRHAGVRGQLSEKLTERLQPSRRPSHPDDAESRILLDP